jgi:hypothetical protein
MRPAAPFAKYVYAIKILPNISTLGIRIILIFTLGPTNQSTIASKALCLTKFARPWITRTDLEIFREQRYFSFARNRLTIPRSSRTQAGHDKTTLHRLLLRIENFNNLFVLFGPWITYIIFTYGRTSVAKKAITLKRGNVYCLFVCVSDITFFLCKKKRKNKKSNEHFVYFGLPGCLDTSK